jgi:hypothetical protein
LHHLHQLIRLQILQGLKKSKNAKQHGDVTRQKGNANTLGFRIETMIENFLSKSSRAISYQVLAPKSQCLIQVTKSQLQAQVDLSPYRSG